MKRWLSLLLAVLLLLTTLTACGSDGGEEEEETPEESMALRVRVSAEQQDLDPVVARQNGGDTLTYHLFENLMRWEDDGTGHAKLDYGMAESYEFTENVDGTVSYTFTIREDAEWSDGKAVTAYQFLYAWRRLFEMEQEPAELSELFMVEGFGEAREAKDGRLLTGVSAPNKRTLVIKLVSHCAYFLDEFCAGTLTMPVREDIIDDHGEAWGKTAKTVIGNGPYRLKAMESGQVRMVRNEKYWDEAITGPDELIFTWKVSAVSDYNELLAGEIDFLAELPAAAVKEMAAAGTLETQPVPATYSLLMNNMAAPFDNEFVRQAFAMLVGPKAMAEELAFTTERAATGFVPYGISNRDSEWMVGTESETEEEPEIVKPEDLVQGTVEEESAAPIHWDYRSVGDYGVMEEELSEDTIATRARVMLSQAGYPNGDEFPIVEYLYVDTPQNTAVAQWLQERFRSMLHVEVTLKPVTNEEAQALLLAGEYTLAAFRFNAAYDDALAFLQRWQSSKSVSSGNLVSFSNRAYDLLLSVVSASNDSAREACLHDAEQLLLESKGIVPLFYYGTTSALREELTGLYHHDGQGVYFFGNVSEIVVEEELPAE